MQRPLLSTFANFVAAPENRPALIALRSVADCVGSGQPHRAVNPLLLHGQTGTGKSHLVSALVDEATRRLPALVATVLPASDAGALERLAGDEGADALDAVRHSDLLVIEDLHYLTPRHAGTLVRIIDYLEPRQVQMVFTARVGPCHLELPSRLTTRLAGGLVVGIEPLSAASRLLVLQDKTQRRQLAVSRDVLTWLAEHLIGGGRQIDGALSRLEALSRTRAQPLDITAVADLFHELVELVRPTVDRIAQKVGGHFRVDLRDLRSERRGRDIVLPRQVGMYLARQLTGLTLEQIGAYFGGRDHSTVLHACRKVEQAMTRDTVLSGTVRQLYLDLA